MLSWCKGIIHSRSLSFMSVHYIYSGTLKLQDPSHFSGFGVAISALASAGAIDVAIQRLDDMVQSGFPAVALPQAF